MQDDTLYLDTRGEAVELRKALEATGPTRFNIVLRHGSGYYLKAVAA